MNNRKKAIAICNQALRELIEELNTKKEAIADRDQLLQFKEHFERIIQQLEDNELPSKNERAVWMGRVIVDSWPLNSKLGNLLCSAEQAYRDA